MPMSERSPTPRPLASMQSITRRELTERAREGEGVVLVDKHHQNADKSSILHGVTCRWARKVGLNTPLRFSATTMGAVRWLDEHRGPEGELWRRCPECGGRASADGFDAPTAGAWCNPDDLVLATDRAVSIGHVVSVEGAEVVISEFDSPALPSVAERTVGAGQLESYVLTEGSRVFARIRDEWSAGRCASPANGGTVEVEAGGHRAAVPTADLRVRRLDSLSDPLGELAAGRVGAPGGFVARSTFQQIYARLAAASRGLAGVTSAAVELHAHQLGVARRVLADPVQRYLLADEVGLGKTIEAGLIIRQRLLDAPRSLVVVFAPEALVWQWEEELQTKLGLSEVRRRAVEVVNFDAPRAFDRKITPDLVVIDEAHRVAAGWESPVEAHAERFQATRDLLDATPRVLLLSATPVLHRERDLFAMLHLLDPDTYRLKDVDKFTDRVKDREQTGELVLALRPGAPAFIITSRLPQLREVFCADDRLLELLDGVECAIAKEHEDDLALALAEAREHIGETYRLHRRLLRNRRSAIADTPYLVRGRSGPAVVNDVDSRRSSAEDWLERWRLSLVADVEDDESATTTDEALEVFLVYARAVSGDLEVLRSLAEWRLTLRRDRRGEAGINEEEAVRLRATALSEEQRDLLKALLLDLGDEEFERERRMADTAGRLVGLFTKPTVVFSDAEATVLALSDALSASGTEGVGIFTGGMDGDARREVVREFNDGQYTVLLCDRSAEEGLNLQRADQLVHLDLPLRTSRVEQRVGRADRRGDGAPVDNVVVVGGERCGTSATWFRVLTECFDVFAQTTAPLQYAIETVERDLLKTLFREGPDGLDDAMLKDVADRVAEEQGRIDRLDALDALARQDADDVAFVNAVEELEQETAGEFSRAVALATPAVGATLAARAQGGRALQFQAWSASLRIFPGLAEHPMPLTAQRSLAVTDPELLLLRPGGPAAEALRIELEHDDRTQTCVAWRVDPSREHDLIGLCCELRVRADPTTAFEVWTELELRRSKAARAHRTDADAPLSLAALQRRVDAYLPPVCLRLWLDEAGAPVAPEVVPSLEEVLADGGDIETWGSRHFDRAADVGGARSLADLVAPIREAAERIAVERAGTLVDRQRAIEHAESEWAGTERLLKLRSEVNVDRAVAKRDLIAEHELAGLLREALREPIAEWCGAALVLITPEAP